MSGNSTGRIKDRTDLERLDRMTEEEIEEAARSDPDSLLLEDCDLSTLRVVMPETKKSISIRIDPDVLSFFKPFGKGYKSRMNAVLRAYMEAHLKNRGSKKTRSK
jgi:uncharacterized protein (DUF4415 family)